MKILITGEGFGFPNGYGATARVLAYARGLAASGVDVLVACLKPSELSGRGSANRQARGTHGAIPFEYACGTTVRGRTFFERRWLELRGAVGLWRLTGSRRKGFGKPDAVIVYSDSVPWVTWSILVAKLRGAKCVLEVCEHPCREGAAGGVIRGWLRVRLVYLLPDAFLVISRCLERLVTSHCRRGVPVLRVPILVDTSLGGGPSRERCEAQTKLVLYIGQLGRADEVRTLLETFSEVAGEVEDAELRVVGDADPDLMGSHHALAKRLGIADRVHFTGFADRTQLVQHLSNAYMFLLPRSKGLFSEAGFPNKLGEYLATGKPVLVTGTGDIPEYLQDGVSAFVVPPDDRRALVEKLSYVLRHPAESFAVGARGRTLAVQEFDERIHGKRIAQLVADMRH